MGIFQSMKEGITEGGSFLLQNSGTILDAAKAVALAAGESAAPVTDVKDDDSRVTNLIVNFLPNFKAANSYLISTAQAALQGPAPTMDGTGATIQQDLLTGAWEMPAPDVGGGVSLSVYHDIAAFLQASGIPTQIEIPPTPHSGPIFFDVAFNMTREFLFLLTPGRHSGHEPDSRGVKTAGFGYTNPKGGISIAAMHAYYAVPMGDAGSNFALHSAICINTLKTQSFAEAEFAKHRDQHSDRISSLSNLVSEPNGPLHWAITFSIQWSTVALAIKATRLLNQELSRVYPIVDQQLYGNTAILKLTAPITSTPGQVKEVVINSINLIGEALYSSHGEPPSTETIAYQLPSVQITNSVVVMNTPAS